jgi:hypothetical protein
VDEVDDALQRSDVLVAVDACVCHGKESFTSSAAFV